MSRILSSLVSPLCVVALAFSGCTASRLTPAERFQVLKGACTSGDVRSVDILLERGADPNGGRDWETEAIGGRFGDEFTSPMTAAAVGGHIEVMKMLLSHGAAIDVMEGEGHTPLSMAIYAKKKESVAFLLSAGADPTTPMVARAVAGCSDAGIRAMVEKSIQERPNLEGCVRPERSGAVNATSVEQAPASPEALQGGAGPGGESGTKVQPAKG